MKDHQRSDMGDEQNKVRVTDRRRVYADQDGTERVNAKVETPNLKPSYVEKLEAEKEAAEKKAEELEAATEKKLQEMKARFDEFRQQLQRETDETRQRLNRSAD